MEKLLHYVWKHHLLPLTPLTTTDGQAVEIINAGLQNTNAGPDFFNAQVRIGGTLWVGNVELHLRSSDWFRHGHDTDAAYNNVILHVAEEVDDEVVTADGKRLPQLQLPISEGVRERYEQLSATDDYPRCWPIVPQLSRLTVHSWLSALLAERLQERAQLCLDRLARVDGDWERALFITLARNFGFGVNGDAFELWARHLPLHAAAKHRDNPFQLEALFLGCAGFLTTDAIPPLAREEAENAPYLQRLRREYDYLSHKFQFPPPMEVHHWRYLRLRPQNFPHLRIVQLAHLYFRQTAGLSSLLEAESREALHAAFDTSATEYWGTQKLSTASKDLLIINTVVPFLFAYGIAHSSEAQQERAVNILEQLKVEHNFIIRQWQQCGLSVEAAADSQALIQLKRKYCDRHDCLRCRFSFEYLWKTV